MAQKIPFFELFPTLELPWELRASLGEAYLTAVEVERQRRELALDLVTQRDLGEGRGAVESALAELTGQQETLKAALLSLVHTFAPGVRDLFGISAAISRALSLEERLSHARVQLEGAAQLADSLPRPQPGEAEAPEGVEPRFDPAETAARTVRIPERAETVQEMGMAQEAGTAWQKTVRKAALRNLAAYLSRLNRRM